jgi:hypothetical protein
MVNVTEKTSLGTITHLGDVRGHCRVEAGSVWVLGCSSFKQNAHGSTIHVDFFIVQTQRLDTVCVHGSKGLVELARRSDPT